LLAIQRGYTLGKTVGSIIIIMSLWSSFAIADDSIFVFENELPPQNESSAQAPINRTPVVSDSAIDNSPTCSKPNIPLFTQLNRVFGTAVDYENTCIYTTVRAVCDGCGDECRSVVRSSCRSQTRELCYFKPGT